MSNSSRHNYSNNTRDSRTRSRSPPRYHHDQRNNSSKYEKDDRRRSDYHNRSYGENRRDRTSHDRGRNDRYHDRGHYERGHDGHRHGAEKLEPNINVVLRNLPDKAREVDIQNKLNSMEASVDDVSLIKDRDTGESRKFAFIRFTSVGHAIQFVEKYRTFDMNSYNVRVDYCKKNKQDEDKEEWRCTKCGHFNQMHRRACVECKQSFLNASAEKRTFDTDTIEINDGTKDISTVPSKIILLRQLDHLSTEESIFESVQSLHGVQRAILIRDKMTKMSCEFAFVEFENVQCAAIALEYARELLTVDGRKVLVSFANQESFIPVYGQSEWAIASDFVDGLCAYWDKSSYASEYSLAIEQERKKKQDELKKAKQQEEAKKSQQQQQAKGSLEDDLSAFYADMCDFGTTDDSNSNSDIFAVPKSRQ